MVHVLNDLFSSDLWNRALEKYAVGTHLTVQLYDRYERRVLGPIHPTPLFQLFDEGGYDPGIFAECARKCLAQTEKRPAVVVAQLHGLAVIGTSLMLEGDVVGAAVGGYVLVDFSQMSEIQLLARQAGIGFEQVWRVAREQQPVPQRRLLVHGELLQVLGDALLSEHYRSRQYENAVVELKKAAAAKDEFIALISHELRNPLTAILGWTRALKRLDSTHHPQAIETIERNALLQLRLIEDLLDLNRLMRGKLSLHPTQLDLSERLASALESIAETAEQKGVALRVTGVEGSLLSQGDPDRLQQIFINILSNAVKFTPNGGSVHVTLATEANSALVTIRDTGKGIAPDFLPHVFEMFRQQEDSTPGTNPGLGIGLALVKNLVDLHGGNIEIKSGLGLGTEVTLRLPRIMSAGGTPMMPQVILDRSPQFQSLSILLVEDSNDTREITRIMLQRLGAQVLPASDGREALDVMAASNPDLVLCDLCMPRMDGFEFIRQLRAIRGSAHPPVIAVSALTTDADHERTRAAGFAAHVNKPLEEISLVSAVRVAIQPAAR